jgi:hypothetical protein
LARKRKPVNRLHIWTPKPVGVIRDHAAHYLFSYHRKGGTMHAMIADEDKIGTEPAVRQTENLLRPSELTSYGVEWTTSTRATPLGGLAYFGHFLHANGLFDRLVAGCPLQYTSNNAPSIRQVLGTVTCAILKGARRYAHVAHIHGDAVCAETMDIKGGFVSEDSVRRGFRKGTREDWDAWDRWLTENEKAAVLPLLTERYILDLDTSVKLVYGRQEGAEIGYNPTRPGRPSQSLHVGFIGGLRLLVSVDVQGGKAHGAGHMAPKIWRWVDSLPQDCKPSLIRGDIGFGNEGYLRECEARELSHLFKIKMSKKVQRLAAKLAAQADENWRPAPGGWEVVDAQLKLTGWSRERRVVVMRRPMPANPLRPRNEPAWLPHLESLAPRTKMEYAVVVCSADLAVDSVPTLYAERADCENVLDELKNQWGLSGFTTQDLLRCKVMARLTALICNWWNVFSRIAEPIEHKEALTSRPELLYVIAILIQHAGKKVLRLCSHHEDAPSVKRAFGRLHRVFAQLDSIAGQLDRPTVWAIQLSVAFYVWLRGKVLKVPAVAEQVIHELAAVPVPAQT